MFQMTVNHPTGSPLYHILMKAFAITIKILKKNQTKHKKDNQTLKYRKLNVPYLKYNFTVL